MSRPDYTKQIENRIQSMPEGAVFITSDFLDLADISAINKALSRSAASGTIRRVVRGVSAAGPPRAKEFRRVRTVEQHRADEQPDDGQGGNSLADGKRQRGEHHRVDRTDPADTFAEQRGGDAKNGEGEDADDERRREREPYDRR